MKKLLVSGAVAVITTLLWVQPGFGQAAADQPDNAALMQKIRDLEDRVISLEGQVRIMKSQQVPPTQPAAPLGAGAATQAAAGQPPAAETTQATQAPAAPESGPGGQQPYA